jgi:hypothetical protein
MAMLFRNMLIAFLIILPSAARAQPGNGNGHGQGQGQGQGNGNGGHGPCADPPCNPVSLEDDGLALAAIAFGLFSLFRRIQAKKKP